MWHMANRSSLLHSGFISVDCDQQPFWIVKGSIQLFIFDIKPNVRREEGGYFTSKLGSQGDNRERLPHAQTLLPVDEYGWWIWLIWLIWLMNMVAETTMICKTATCQWIMSCSWSWCRAPVAPCSSAGPTGQKRPILDSVSIWNNHPLKPSILGGNHKMVIPHVFMVYEILDQSVGLLLFWGEPNCSRCYPFVIFFFMKYDCGTLVHMGRNKVLLFVLQIVDVLLKHFDFTGIILVYCIKYKLPAAVWLILCMFDWKLHLQSNFWHDHRSQIFIGT